jgi:hypothetical protein
MNENSGCVQDCYHMSRLGIKILIGKAKYFQSHPACTGIGYVPPEEIPQKAFQNFQVNNRSKKLRVSQFQVTYQPITS